MPHGSWRDAWCGCDVDEEAIGWLRQQGVSSAKKCGELPPLPYPAECSEVFSFPVLTHIHPQQHRSWYEEMSRVLKPRGPALLTTQGDAIHASNRIADSEALDRY